MMFNALRINIFICNPCEACEIMYRELNFQPVERCHRVFLIFFIIAHFPYSKVEGLGMLMIMVMII